MYVLIHTLPDRTEVRYPAKTEKADAAQLVYNALRAADVPVAGIIWRVIAKGLMQSPLGDTVLGINRHHFTIVEGTTPVSLVKKPALYLAGTLNEWNADPDEMVRAQENKNGPRQTHGWINPQWSMWTLHDRRSDAGPAEVYDAEYDGDLARWLADKIAWHLGAIDSANGNVLYASDAYTDFGRTSDTDDDISLSLIVEHVDDATLDRALHILQAQQGHKFLYDAS